MKIDAFRELDEYYEAIDTWIDRFKSSEPINPNEPVLCMVSQKRYITMSAKQKEYPER